MFRFKECECKSHRRLYEIQARVKNLNLKNAQASSGLRGSTCRGRSRRLRRCCQSWGGSRDRTSWVIQLYIPESHSRRRGNYRIINCRYDTRVHSLYNFLTWSCDACHWLELQADCSACPCRLRMVNVWEERKKLNPSAMWLGCRWRQHWDACSYMTAVLMVRMTAANVHV